MGCCRCTKKTADIECTRCFTSTAWVARFAGPIQKGIGGPAAITGTDQFPPLVSDATPNCGFRILDPNSGLPGFDSNTYVSPGVNFFNMPEAATKHYTVIGDPYCPVVLGNYAGNTQGGGNIGIGGIGEEPTTSTRYIRIFDSGGLYGVFFCQHATGFDAWRLGNRFQHNFQNAPWADPELFGFYLKSPDALIREDFEKTLIVDYKHYRAGRSPNYFNGSALPNGGWVNRMQDTAPRNLRDDTNRVGSGRFNFLASQTIEPFSASQTAVGYFVAPITVSATESFIDGYGHTHFIRDLVSTTEANREVFVRTGTAFGPPRFFPTGVLLKDVIEQTVRVTSSVTNVAVVPIDDAGNADITYTTRAQIPLLGFDEASVGNVQRVGRCQHGKVTARCYSSMRDATPQFANRTINNGLTQNPGWQTLLSGHCFSSWEPLVNEGLVDEQKATFFIPSIEYMEVGVEQIPESGFRLRRATWTKQNGDVVTLEAFRDFTDWTIPSGETWDVGTAYIGDSLTLRFDNLGTVTAEVTNVTFGGSVVTTVDKTTETFAAYQTKEFLLDGPSTTLAANSESTITVTHDANGEIIPSPFTLTIRLGGGALAAP